ncbi:hypothetical protein QYF36_008594 [Acer negundo]|nr:hypothetical protein QYF36_008594 [Acer negundo]
MQLLKRFIVFGAGSTQLLNAVVHALSLDNSSSPARVVASIPFYPVCTLTYILVGLYSLDNFAAFAWVKCEREEDRNCYEILKAAKIIGRADRIFQGLDQYVHLSLLRSQDDFDLLIHRLSKLVSEENGAKTM